MYTLHLSSPRRIAPLVWVLLVPLAQHVVHSGPIAIGDWDLGSFLPDSDVPSLADSWNPDSSTTDVDMFSLQDSSSLGSVVEDNNDLLLADSASCRSDAGVDLTQFEPYSKLRAREACSVKPSTPPLALPSLDKLPGPEGDGQESNGDGGTISIDGLERAFGLPGTSTTGDKTANQLCPADKTFTSQTPVCDSGFSSDAKALAGFAYSTLYNIQPYNPATCHFPKTLWCCLLVRSEEHPEWYSPILVGYVCYSPLPWDFVI